MSRDDVKVDHGPGIIRRLFSRVHSSSPNDPSNTNDKSSGNGHASDHASRPRTTPFKTPSFKVGSGSASSSFPNLPGKKGSPPSTTSARPHPESGLSRELWDEAYDALRHDPSTTGLVVTYEAIISQELPDDLKVATNSTLSAPDGNADRRMELMTAIASAGLRKRRGSKTSQIDDTRQILEHSKHVVEAALDSFPSAALAWSGICTLTPLLIDPILRHDEFRRGMIHIIGRIPWYMHLTHLLQCPSRVDADDLDARQHELHHRRERTRDAIVRLYRHVLEFEMNCVCATASAWNSVAKHAVRWQTLDKLVDSIFEGDERVRELVAEYVTDGPQRSQMLARDIDLDVDALEKARSQEEDDGPIEEQRKD